jgi:hypothetical protein
MSSSKYHTSTAMTWAGGGERAPTPEAEPGTNRMRKQMEKFMGQPQPEPFTPGLTKRMVHEHALWLYEGRILEEWPIAREDWILVEHDLLKEYRNRGS